MTRFFGYSRILSTGAPAPLADVDVFNAGTLVRPSLFQDRTGTTVLANPFQADANGYFYFYAADGEYDVGFSGGGIAAPYTWGDVQIGNNDLIANIVDYGAQSLPGFDNSPYIQAALDDSAAVWVPAGTFEFTASMLVGFTEPKQIVMIDADATLEYKPTSGTAPAILMNNQSRIWGGGRFASVINVNRNGCHGIQVTAGATVSVSDIKLYDVVQATRTTGDGIHIGDGISGTRSTLENIEIDGFLDGVSMDMVFVTSLLNVNSAGSRRDGYHVAGSCTSISFTTCYANNTIRHGFYFSGHQAYCTFTGTAADIGFDATGGSGYGYYLDATGGNVCQSFTFNSAACETGQYSLGGVFCNDGGGHVFNACYIINVSGLGTSNGYTFAGTQDVTVNRGVISGWRGVGATEGHDVYALTSGSGTVPARIAVFDAIALAGFPSQGTHIYAPNGGVTLMQASTGWTALSLLNGWSNVGGAYQTAQYMRDANGVVHVRGAITGGTAVNGTPLFTLPANFRPTATEFISVASDNEFGSVVVLSTGVCQFYRGANVMFGIDFSFVTDLTFANQNPV